MSFCLEFYCIEQMFKAKRAWTKQPFEGNSEIRQAPTFLRALKVDCKQYRWFYEKTFTALVEPRESEVNYFERSRVHTKEVESTAKVEQILLARIGSEPRGLIQGALDDVEVACSRTRIRNAMDVFKEFYLEDITQIATDIKTDMTNLPVITELDQLEHLLLTIQELQMELQDLDSEMKLQFNMIVSLADNELTSLLRSKLHGESFRTTREDITKDQQKTSKIEATKLRAVEEFYQGNGRDASTATEDSGDEQKDVSMLLSKVRTRMIRELQAIIFGEWRAENPNAIDPPLEVQERVEKVFQDASADENPPPLTSEEVAHMMQCSIDRRVRVQERKDKRTSKLNSVLMTNAPEKSGMAYQRAVAVARKNRAAHSRSDQVVSAAGGWEKTVVSVASVDHGSRDRSRAPEAAASQRSPSADRGHYQGSPARESHGTSSERMGELRPRSEDRGWSPSAECASPNKFQGNEQGWGGGGGRGGGDVRARRDDRRRSPSAERHQRVSSPSRWREERGTGGVGGGGSIYEPPSPTPGLCLQYTSNGSCKFGSVCKFVHQSPTAADKQGGGWGKRPREPDRRGGGGRSPSPRGH